MGQQWLFLFVITQVTEKGDILVKQKFPGRLFLKIFLNKGGENRNDWNNTVCADDFGFFTVCMV